MTKIKNSTKKRVEAIHSDKPLEDFFKQKLVSPVKKSEKEDEDMSHEENEYMETKERKKKKDKKRERKSTHERGEDESVSKSPSKLSGEGSDKETKKDKKKKKKKSKKKKNKSESISPSKLSEDSESREPSAKKEKNSIEKKIYQEDEKLKPSPKGSDDDNDDYIGKRGLRRNRKQKYNRQLNSDSEGAEQSEEEKKRGSEDDDYSAPILDRDELKAYKDGQPKKRGRPKGQKSDTPSPKKIQKTTSPAKSSSFQAKTKVSATVSVQNKPQEVKQQVPKPEDRVSVEQESSKRKQQPEQSDIFGAEEEFKINEEEMNEIDEDEMLDDNEDFDIDNSAPKTRKIKTEDNIVHQELAENVFIDNLPKDRLGINKMAMEVNKNIRRLEIQFFEEEDSENDMFFEKDLKDQETSSQDHNKCLEKLKGRSHITQYFCIPLSINVMDLISSRTQDEKGQKVLKIDSFVDSQMKHGGRMFDVITCDPPWQLSSANPTRGVAIAYSTLKDAEILEIPFDRLQENGYLFIWVINAKYRFAITLFDKFGYRLVDEIAWVKQTVNGKIAKGHGFYLQHAKETCLIGVKGDVSKHGRFNIKSDVIFSQRRGQSQKPEEIYDLAEALIPNGYYLEIFGRRNNLHNGWVTIGNEL